VRRKTWRWLIALSAALAVGLRLAEGQWGLRPSTRRLWREARAAGQPWWRFAHTYAYARWPLGYIGSAIGERRELLPLRALFAPFLLRALSPHRWADEYHGKVMPTSAATRLVTVNETVHLAVPEQVIPYESARELVLTHPQRLAVLRCPCRLARKDPCLPLDVCLIVGDPFASFITEHHPRDARPITSDEALRILEAEADRGHVHHAFFKEAMLGRFYAICNCCSCCCGAMQAQRSGTPMLISSGYTSVAAPEQCKNCGTCVGLCPFGAITQSAQGARPVIDTTPCMGCGVCVRHCPNHALRLLRDASKPAPLEVPQSA
jgi:Pyruvate/2-oxoacid:ferredoxin oxidoreductase delta subunit